MDFNKFALKGNEMLNALAKELGITRKEAGRILKAVLHAIRDHLSVQESLHVVDQLPMALKGLYVSQWNVSRRPLRVRSIADFLNTVRLYDGTQAEGDLGDDEWASTIVQAVFTILNKYISDGQFEDIIAVMPAKLKNFIADNIGKDK